MTAYVPRYFKVQELVDPITYKELGDKALGLVDLDLVKDCDRLRDKFGSCTINNWSAGGQFKESGLRRKGTKTGAKNSAHKLGKAFDLKFAKAKPREVYDHILANPELYPAITELENIAFTRTWLHVSSRPHAGKGIRIVNP